MMGKISPEYVDCSQVREKEQIKVSHVPAWLVAEDEMKEVADQLWVALTKKKKTTDAQEDAASTTDDAA